MWLRDENSTTLWCDGMNNGTHKGCFPASPFLTTMSTTDRWSIVNASSPKAISPVKATNQPKRRVSTSKTERTDILRRILNLREQGRDLGHIERFHVEHGVVGTVVHGVEHDLKIDNFAGRR